MRVQEVFGGIVLSSLVLSIQASAVNITIFDGATSGANPWYGAGEVGEVEPGNLTGPAWDLKAFLLDGSSLSIVSTYNLKSGEKDPWNRRGYDGNVNWTPGHIFLDINGGGYDYAILPSMESAGMSYDIVNLNGATLIAPWFSQNAASGPWRVNSYAENGFVTSGTGTYVTGAAVEGLGTGNNVMTVDLGWLERTTYNPGDEILFHYTMECGNDNLMGRGRVGVPDGGATAALMGLGLLALGVARRARREA